MTTADDIVWTIKVNKKMDEAVNKVIMMLGYKSKAELAREAIRDFILRRNLFVLFGKELTIPIKAEKTPEEAIKEITSLLTTVPKEKLKVYLHLYSDMSVKKEIGFWSKILSIPLSQFTKPYIRKDFKPEKSGKMKHGLAHIRYSDKKLFLKIQGWIKEYLKRNNIEGASTEAVKPDSL